jgi:hypothetical protein
VKGAALFLLAFLPSSAILLWVSQGELSSPRLPERRDEAGAEPILVAGDLGRGKGAAPAPPGRLLRLDGFRLDVVEEGQPRHELSIGGLVREEGRPRLKGIRLVSRDDSGRVERTLESGYLDGDPARLVTRGSGEPILLALRGGVRVLDGKGRLIAEVEEGLLALPEGRFDSSSPVTLHEPDLGVEVRAGGISADERGGDATLRGKVVARIPDGDVAAIVTIDGAAAVRRSGGRVRLETGCPILLEHPLVRGSCAGGTFEFPEGEAEKSRLPTTSLDGPVEARFDEKAGRGLRSLRAARVLLSGRDLLLEGPVRLEAEGSLPGAGAEGRPFTVDAGAALVRLRPARRGGPGFEVERVLVHGGFSATEKDGPARLRGDAALLSPGDGLVVAFGKVEAESAEGSLRGDSLVAFPLPGGSHAIEVGGPQKTSLRRKEGAFDLSSGGPLRIVGSETARVVAAAGGVLFGTHGEREILLRADSVRAALSGDALRRASGTGHVRFEDPKRGAVLEASHVETEGEEKVLARGAPAILTLSRGANVSVVEALRLDFDGGRRDFSAAGDVRCRLEGGRSLRCEALSGRLDENQEPLSLAAEGAVEASLPKGERVLGDRLDVDLRTERATVRGAPARLFGADGLEVAAPGFDLGFRKEGGRYLLGNASAIGAGTASLRVEGKPGEGRTVRAAFHGPALLEKGRLWIAKGASFEALDDRGGVAARGEARSVALFVEEREGKLLPIEAVGLGGIVVEGTREGKRQRLSAKEARYRWGDSRLLLTGEGRIEGDGGSSARFSRAELVLTKTGLEILSVTDFEAEKPR